MLAFFPTLGEHGHTELDGVVNDLFRETPGGLRDLDRAFADVRGVVVAGAETRRAGFNPDGLPAQTSNLLELTAGAVSDGGRVPGVRTSIRLLRVDSRVTLPPPETSPGLDGELIRRFVKRRMGAVESCYERRLKRVPTLSGRVVVSFVVGVNGRVVDAEILENAMGDRFVVECILSWSGLDLPAAHHGGRGRGHDPLPVRAAARLT